MCECRYTVCIFDTYRENKPIWFGLIQVDSNLTELIGEEDTGKLKALLESKDKSKSVLIEVKHTLL